MNSRALLLISTWLLAGVAFGTPPNTAVLDGRMGEYDAFDKKGSYTGGGGVFGAGNYLNDVYITWDETYLYVALAGAEVDNRFAVLIDVDPGSGTGATTTTNWTGSAASFISYNDLGWVALTNGFGLDFMVASDGLSNNVVQVLYDGVAAPDTSNVLPLLDAGNGANTLGTPVDMAVYGDTSTCNLNGFEARIPWSVLYGSNGGRYGTVNGGEVVPQGAIIRLFASLHNNNPGIAYSSNDAIPQQSGGAWSGGLLTSDTYLDIPLDPDGDGFPDLESGDRNAPWIRFSMGLAGTSNVYVQFNEPLNAETAILNNSWQVGGSSPSSVTMITTNLVLLTLTNALPAAGTLVEVLSTDIEDNAENARANTACLIPVASGLTNLLTVRFYLETASGLGVNPGASNFFINGGSPPLAFGLPPPISEPLLLDSGTVYYRDVVFPPGTPATLRYKYSGQLSTTGTNTYEAVRLANYHSAARVLTLAPGLTSLVVTDYLGAVAEPLRDPSTNASHHALFADPQRGDAGVRQRTTVKFQLDLSARDRAGVARVLIQGSDPLRGFNANDQLIPGDFAGRLTPAWLVGGVTLVDDGTLGDVTPDDGIYSRDWIFSVNGYDSVAEPGSPHSLVGGDGNTEPYRGDILWVAGRSPRSVIYKFYVYKSGPSALESPASDIELYIEESAGTNVVLSPFIWANDDLPLPPPSSGPTMGRPVLLTNNQVRVVFTNLPSEVSGHGILIATNLMKPGWMDFGLRASGSSGNWTATVNNAHPGSELYAAFAGPAAPRGRITWSPNPVPATGAVMRFRYNQNQRVLAGFRDVTWQGQHPGGGFTNSVAMTFSNQGVWWSSFTVPAHTNGFVEFLVRDGGSTIYDQPAPFVNFKAQVGGRASWSPDAGVPGGSLTVTYVPAGGPLATASVVRLFHGFDGFNGVTQPEMAHAGGDSNVWTYTLTIPANRTNAVDLLFNGVVGAETNLFDNNSSNDWHVFIEP